MYKILISGYYGFNNIGDESILMAVSESLRESVPNIEITVLSYDPEDTEKKYNVKACPRKSLFSIIKAVLKCDLLISGGGSLLQDVTSKKSILYYLFIMWLAKILGKDYMVYSQGIGPINSKFNRKITARVLDKAAGIVVRDEFSKEFLTELGIDSDKVVVTADPVLRIKKAELCEGKKILQNEGCQFALHDKENGMEQDYKIVGFAVKERKITSEFVDELTESAIALITQKNCKIVLIPFHYSEDMAVIEELEKRLIEKGYEDSICAIKHKYLTNEMMSIIGNMDILVGVRLHSLIHAAIMGVPMIGISYDPKVNSFMRSMGLKAMCSIYDFNSEFFLEEFEKTINKKDIIAEKIKYNVEILIEKLDTNEEMIRRLREK